MEVEQHQRYQLSSILVPHPSWLCSPPPQTGTAMGQVGTARERVGWGMPTLVQKEATRELGLVLSGPAPSPSLLLFSPSLPMQHPWPEEPSLLQQYKDSGLSSSSYELSQYMGNASNQYEAAPSRDWSPIQAEDIRAASSRPVAPQKFSLPHVPVCFGAGGQLVRGCPNYPAEGQPALVEIHSLEVLLHDTAEQEAMRVFPGPLIREDLHKVDVMTFCRRRAAMGCDPASSPGRDSALLWKLLLLLCQQNGSMVGSDIAELLMQERKHRERYRRQEPEANLINLVEEEWPAQGCGMTDLLTGGVVPSVATPEQTVEKFTKLLLHGRKKEALDWAMRNHLWGHALFLSSKMDLRTYSWVLSGFTSTLAVNDPLQTLFQLMSGRIPQASLCCGDEKWGDWKPHLAVILSNQVGDPGLNSKAIVTMGDTLAAKELIEAAHVCYLMADVPFGHYGVKADRMVLLGSSQR
uniref:Protein transport protein sec16 n=1 Tax=Varanus komodoensis TaxID=61221 RepID=A0A8D2L764_VARKO